jgi:ribosomal protein L37AE/L43A
MTLNPGAALDSRPSFSAPLSSCPCCQPNTSMGTPSSHLAVVVCRECGRDGKDGYGAYDGNDGTTWYCSWCWQRYFDTHRGEMFGKPQTIPAAHGDDGDGDGDGDEDEDEDEDDDPENVSEPNSDQRNGTIPQSSSHSLHDSDTATPDAETTATFQRMYLERLNSTQLAHTSSSRECGQCGDLKVEGRVDVTDNIWYCDACWLAFEDTTRSDEDELEAAMDENEEAESDGEGQVEEAKEPSRINSGSPAKATISQDQSPIGDKHNLTKLTGIVNQAAEDTHSTRVTSSINQFHPVPINGYDRVDTCETWRLTICVFALVSSC